MSEGKLTDCANAAIPARDWLDAREGTDLYARSIDYGPCPPLAIPRHLWEDQQDLNSTTVSDPLLTQSLCVNSVP